VKLNVGVRVKNQTDEQNRHPAEKFGVHAASAAKDAGLVKVLVS